jgi:acetoin utilization protein AcuB
MIDKKLPFEEIMKVKELMTKEVLTVCPTDKIDRVFFLINFENIRHVPVVDKGKLVGMLSDRDLKKVLGPAKKFVEKPDGTTVTIASRQVRTLMSRKLTTIEPEQRAADAAAIMAKRKIGALPVVHKQKLIGIITATDILQAFVQLCNRIEPLGKDKE